MPEESRIVSADGERLDRRHRAAVDDVLTAVNEGSAVGDEECDQLRHLCGAAGPADRDPAQ